jgi:hypothetical protein
LPHYASVVWGDMTCSIIIQSQFIL